MSSENSVLQENELQSTTILNDILDKMNHMPNMAHVVNSINHLNDICVPMIGAKSLLTGYNEQSNGITGFVPAPDVTESGKFLRGDGTWQTVVTSVDPLRTEQMITDLRVKDAQSYPYLQPSSDTSDTANSLKYNTNLSFGRRYANFGTDYKVYTTLEIKSDGNDCIDNAIIFKSATDSGKSSTLLANLESLKNDAYVKMPTVSGMLLTDAGFTVNGSANFNQGIDIKNGTLSLRNISNSSHWNVDGSLGVSLKLNYNSIINDGLISETFATFYVGGKDGIRTTNFDSNLTAYSILINGVNGDGRVNYYAIEQSGSTTLHTAFWGNLRFDIRDPNQESVLASILMSDRNVITNSDYLVVTPINYAGESLIEGGQLQLSARTGQTYGNIEIDNYDGSCRIFNDKYTDQIVTITPSKSTTSEPTIDASEYTINSSILNTTYITATEAATANVITSTSGQVNFSSNGAINLNLHSDGGDHIDSTVPMSTSVDTPVGDAGKRFYRPIIVSNAAPSSKDVVKNGDIWIQYS